MWIFLAVLAFIAGQVYLFYLLNRLDRFLERQADPPPEQETLTVAFADSSAADSIAGLLERFSLRYPNIEIRLRSCQDVPEAVDAGKAAVGFLQAGRFESPEFKHFPMTVKTAPITLAGRGLEVVPMETESKQEMVWKKNGASELGHCPWDPGPATLVGYTFLKVGFTQANIIAIFLLAVLLTSMATSTRSSYVLSAIGSLLVFNFFFATPRFSLRVYEHGAPMTFLVMIVVALSVGTLTDRLKSQVRQSTQAAYRTNLLFETNQMLQQASTDDAVFQAARIRLQKLLNRDVAVYPGIVSNAKQDTICYPLRINERTYGTAVIQGRTPLEAFENSVLLSILGECALALENSQNAREKEEARFLAENEKLRANLLRSISHDLRTPLTAISGNAAILLSGEGSIDPSQKQQIYTDIYDDAAWLTNLVENLLAVTRIE